MRFTLKRFFFNSKYFLAKKELHVIFLKSRFQNKTYYAEIQIFNFKLFLKNPFSTILKS